MKTALIMLTMATSLFADEVSEDVRTASPDGSFQIVIAEVGDTNTRRLEILDKGGKILFSSPPQMDGADIFDFYDEHLRWSADSRILAISAGYSKLFRTYLFVWDGKNFQQVSMPELAAGEDNPWIYPIDWKDNHTLHLEITGPHAGKADGIGYAGKAIVQVDLQSKTTKKISEEVGP